MTHWRWLGLALLLIVGALACGADTLTREKAKELIQGSKDLAPTTSVLLQGGGYAKGVKHGRWNNTGQPGPGATEAISGSNQTAMNLRAGVSRAVVEVTGIADLPMGPTLKQVMFVWAYQDIPAPASWYALRGGEGSAVLRLYDDGWRVEEVRLTHGKEPWPLSSDDQVGIAAYEKAYDEELQAARRAEEDRRRAEEEAKSRLVAESKLAKRTVLTIDGVRRGQGLGWNSSSYCEPVSLQVTDAGLSLPLPAGCEAKVSVTNIPYHDLKKITEMNHPENSTIYFVLDGREKSFMLKFADGADCAKFRTTATDELKAWRERYPFGAR